MMRVLFSSHTYVEPDYHAKLIRLAELQNLELCLVVPDVWSDPLFDYSGVCAQGHYTLVKLPIIGRQCGNAFLYRAKLRELIREFNPDILHIEQEPRSLVTAQWLLANQEHAKTIVFTWENVAQPFRIPQSWCERYTLNHADAMIGGNAASVRLLHDKGWRGATWVLPQIGVEPAWGAHASGIRVREQFQLGGDFVVGFVGRLVEYKGIGDLLVATAGLDRTRVFLIGQGDFRNSLVHSRLAYSPPVPHAHLADYFAALDVLVLPSHSTPRWKEQFGRVLIEAMACGVPVVGSDSGAIPEVIGDAGLVFPEGDVNALRDCLMYLHDNPGARAELSARGRARVLANYTNEHIAAQTFAVYQELLELK